MNYKHYDQTSFLTHIMFYVLVRDTKATQSLTLVTGATFNSAHSTQKVKKEGLPVLQISIFNFCEVLFVLPFILEHDQSL